jgi:hypothetical protein
VAIDTIRRQILIACLPLALCACAGCDVGAPNLAGRTEEEPPRPAAEIQVADPRATPQLVSGWYRVEEGAWRWTARKFAAVLRPPIGAARTGAILKLNFTLPDVVISRSRSVTLSASVRGTRLAPETYSKPGKSVYTREVPAALLTGHEVRIDFELDKAMMPGNGDRRELGIVADLVGLETK